jgi:hypothetical protein
MVTGWKQQEIKITLCIPVSTGMFLLPYIAQQCGFIPLIVGREIGVIIQEMESYAISFTI